MALHLRGGVPRGALADGLAVRAAEVPLLDLGDSGFYLFIYFFIFM